MNPEKMSPEELEQFIHRELRALPARKAPAGFEARLQAKLEARATQPVLSADQVEQLVHRELRALPPRRAPRTLESRVLAALEHRASIPWYHKSWAHWPSAVRATFLAFATGVSGLAVAAFAMLTQGAESGALTEVLHERFSGVVALWHVASWASDFVSRSVASIPTLWLYGGLTVVAAMYLAFFGLGAAAYRTLYRTSS